MKTFTSEERVALARAQSARFWSKVNRGESCWLWTAAVDKDGYGKFQLTTFSKPKQIHVRAHRCAYEMANGAVDESAVMIHSCDTPRCVNPSHLRPGTQGENRADCTRKGRNATGDRSGSRKHPERLPSGEDHWMRKHPERILRGEKHVASKLTEAQVIEILSRRGHESQSKLAARFGVAKGTIANIWLRRVWAHVGVSR